MRDYSYLVGKKILHKSSGVIIRPNSVVQTDSVSYTHDYEVIEGEDDADTYYFAGNAGDDFFDDYYEILEEHITNWQEVFEDE